MTTDSDGNFIKIVDITENTSLLQVMDYTKTIDFDGDFSNVVDIAENTALTEGFKITNRDNSSIKLERKPSFMSNRQKPLYGISKIHIQKVNDSMTIEAEFGGFTKTFKFFSIIAIVTDMILLPLIITMMVKSEAPIQKIVLVTALILFGLVMGIPMMYIILKNQAIQSTNKFLTKLTTPDSKKENKILNLILSFFNR